MNTSLKKTILRSNPIYDKNIGSNTFLEDEINDKFDIIKATILEAQVKTVSKRS